MKKSKKGQTLILRNISPNDLKLKKEPEGGITKESLNDFITKNKDKLEIKKTPDIQLLGISNVNQFLDNLQTISIRVDIAIENEEYIEAFTLIQLLIELDLRFFLTDKSKKQVNPGRQFSNILKTIKEEHDFDISLYEDIYSFNEIRNKVIHRFLLGEISEDQILAELDIYKDLHNVVKDYIIKQVGEIMNNP